MKTLPAPGPISGSETEMAFPASAVAAIAGIVARTPAARRTILWVRAKAIIDRSSNATAASSHSHSARPTMPTDWLTVVRSNHPTAINAARTRTSVTFRSQGRRRPSLERSPLPGARGSSGGGLDSLTGKASRMITGFLRIQEARDSVVKGISLCVPPADPPITVALALAQRGRDRSPRATARP